MGIRVPRSIGISGVVFPSDLVLRILDLRLRRAIFLVSLRGLESNKRIRKLWVGEQQAALVAFMKTLTDDSLISDPKFSDPFVRLKATK